MKERLIEIAHEAFIKSCGNMTQGEAFQYAEDLFNWAEEFKLDSEKTESTKSGCGNSSWKELHDELRDRVKASGSSEIITPKVEEEQTVEFTLGESKASVTLKGDPSILVRVFRGLGELVQDAVSR